MKKTFLEGEWKKVCPACQKTQGDHFTVYELAKGFNVECCAQCKIRLQVFIETRLRENQSKAKGKRKK